MLPGTEPIDACRPFVQQLARDCDVVCTAAASGPSGTPKLMASAFVAASEGLKAMLALGRRGIVADAADVGFLRVLLADRRPADVEGFVNAALGPVVEHDRRRGTDLLGTLMQYLEAQGNATQAARFLHIHANTLYKRLKRLAEVLGPDWEEPERRLQLELALVFKRIQQSG